MAVTVSVLLSSLATSLVVVPSALQVGYEQGLTDMQNAMDQAGVYTSWELNGDGSYTIKVLGGNGAIAVEYVSRLDMVVEQYRDGKLIARSVHAMTVTNFGKDWVEQQLFTDTNYTTNALFISTSNDETSVSTAWTILPNEITANGLERAEGTYTSTGVGACNITKTFSVSDTQSCCLYGINAGAYDGYANSLIAAEQQGSGARKNLVAGDTLAVTVMWSHS